MIIQLDFLLKIAYLSLQVKFSLTREDGVEIKVRGNCDGQNLLNKFSIILLFSVLYFSFSISKNSHDFYSHYCFELVVMDLKHISLFLLFSMNFPIKSRQLLCSGSSCVWCCLDFNRRSEIPHPSRRAPISSPSDYSNRWPPTQATVRQNQQAFDLRLHPLSPPPPTPLFDFPSPLLLFAHCYLLILWTIFLVFVDGYSSHSLSYWIIAHHFINKRYSEFTLTSQFLHYFCKLETVLVQNRFLVPRSAKLPHPHLPSTIPNCLPSGIRRAHPPICSHT